MDDVLFNQWGILAGATGIDCTTPYSGDATDFASNMEQKKEKCAGFSVEEKPAALPGAACLAHRQGGYGRFRL
jgi:hypothetical protein